MHDAFQHFLDAQEPVMAAVLGR